MKEEALHILHLEDDPKDAVLIEAFLKSAGVRCTITCVSRREEFHAVLSDKKLDLILSDFSLPQFDGMTALTLAREQRPEVPFIFLSGTMGEELAVSALKQGATDYLLKDRMSRLAPAIQRALSESLEITQRRRVEEELRVGAQRFQQLLAHSPAVIYSMQIDGVTTAPIFVSENITSLLGFAVQECLAASWWQDQLHPEDRESALALLPVLLAQGTSTGEYRLRHRDGTYHWIQDDARLVGADVSKPFKVVGAWTDITERRQTRMDLIEASRLAGKAEVATGILHDVRNVLTSVNVSIDLLRAKVKQLSVDNLQKVATLLGGQSDLSAFLTGDVRGRKLPGYLTALAGRLTQEQQDVVTELEILKKNADHVQHVISMQQGYAKVSGTKETVSLQDIIEESLRLNAISVADHDLKVVKEFSAVPPVTIEKHKLLQILVNLIRNARQACEAGPRPDKIITLVISCDNDWIGISVMDNGVGIPSENLPRLFEHGFTTKKDGHGFGLRSAAITAQELGGSLAAESAGPHLGASFILKLPAPTRT